MWVYRKFLCAAFNLGHTCGCKSRLGNGWLSRVVIADFGWGDPGRGKLCRKRAGLSVARVTGGDWSAALANVQAATRRNDYRPERGYFSETSEKSVLDPPSQDRNGEGSEDRGISHHQNSVRQRDRGRGMYRQHDQAKKGR
jgi:hypothetical protein